MQNLAFWGRGINGISCTPQVITSGRYLARKSEGKRPLGRPELDGRTLKCIIIQKQDGTIQID
jgi:hypothetical protein